MIKLKFRRLDRGWEMWRARHSPFLCEISGTTTLGAGPYRAHVCRGDYCILRDAGQPSEHASLASAIGACSAAVRAALEDRVVALRILVGLHSCCSRDVTVETRRIFLHGRGDL